MNTIECTSKNTPKKRNINSCFCSALSVCKEVHWTVDLLNLFSVFPKYNFACLCSELCSGLCACDRDMFVVAEKLERLFQYTCTHPLEKGVSKLRAVGG